MDEENRAVWQEHDVLPAATKGVRVYSYGVEYPTPLYYLDSNDKEWIVFLLPLRINILRNSFRCDSYLYDIENDEFIPFIRY